MKRMVIAVLSAFIIGAPLVKAEPLVDQTKQQAENLLSRWTDALLSLRIEEGEDYGNFECPACGSVHGRTIDMVWPLTWLWQRTGQEKYLEAARDVVAWGIAHLQQPDGSYRNDYTSSWRGITEFSQISIGKTLLRFGDVLPEDIASVWRDLFVRQTEYIYNWILEAGDPNVNYEAARPLCMELAYRLTGEERFRECARQKAELVTSFISPDGLLYGESHPLGLTSPRGLRGVDMGYNVEESFPLLLEYADMVGDKALLDVLMESARVHMDFILPDGGLDNSFGTRSIKWSYWGSRTSDGCLIMLSVLARNGCPEALRAAKLTLDLYERCTDSSGLLTGGLFYEKAGEPACIHHSFCHIKPLPDWIDADFPDIDGSAPLLSETAFGIKHYPSRGVHIIGIKNWRATVNQADNWFHRESQTTGGGSLSLLYHRKAGIVLAGTALVYKTDEARNMQWQKNDTITRSFTPRLEKGTATSVYDKDADVKIEGGKNNARVTVEGNLTEEDGSRKDPFRIEYSLRGNTLRITVSGTGDFILPVICAPGDAVDASAAKKITIARDVAGISVKSNQNITMVRSARPDGLAFTPVAGLAGAYLSIPADGKTTRIILKIK